MVQDNIERITTHNFTPQVSKAYKNKGLDRKDPYADLKQDISIYS